MTSSISETYLESGSSGAMQSVAAAAAAATDGRNNLYSISDESGDVAPVAARSEEKRGTMRGAIQVNRLAPGNSPSRGHQNSQSSGSGSAGGGGGGGLTLAAVRERFDPEQSQTRSEQVHSEKESESQSSGEGWDKQAKRVQSGPHDTGAGAHMKRRTAAGAQVSSDRPDSIGRYRMQRPSCFALLPPNTRDAPQLHELMQSNQRLQIQKKRRANRAKPAPIGSLIGMSVSLFRTPGGMDAQLLENGSSSSRRSGKEAKLEPIRVQDISAGGNGNIVNVCLPSYVSHMLGERLTGPVGSMKVPWAFVKNSTLTRATKSDEGFSKLESSQSQQNNSPLHDLEELSRRSGVSGGQQVSTSSEGERSVRVALLRRRPHGPGLVYGAHGTGVATGPGRLGAPVPRRPAGHKLSEPELILLAKSGFDPTTLAANGMPAGPSNNRSSGGALQQRPTGARSPTPPHMHAMAARIRRYASPTGEHTSSADGDESGPTKLPPIPLKQATNANRVIGGVVRLGNKYIQISQQILPPFQPPLPQIARSLESASKPEAIDAVPQPQTQSHQQTDWKPPARKVSALDAPSIVVERASSPVPPGLQEGLEEEEELSPPTAGTDAEVGVSRQEKRAEVLASLIGEIQQLGEHTQQLERRISQTVAPPAVQLVAATDGPTPSPVLSTRAPASSPAPPETPAPAVSVTVEAPPEDPQNESASGRHVDAHSFKRHSPNTGAPLEHRALSQVVEEPTREQLVPALVVTEPSRPPSPASSVGPPAEPVPYPESEPKAAAAPEAVYTEGTTQT